MSLRKSIIVWIAGAVLGWVVAVVAIYGALRLDDNDRLAEENRQEEDTSIADQEKALQEIEPAAGDEGEEERNPRD